MVQNRIWNNEPLSSLTHCIALLLSIAALVVLVVFAAQSASAWHVVGFSIFGASLILLYLASTIYHIIPKETKAKTILQKIDHAMIYVLIAGTYTPVCIVALRGGWGWSLFGVIWGLAVTGIIIKTTGVNMKPWLSTLLYIAMGWIAIIAAGPLVRALSPIGFMWVVFGGVLYTLGTIFFALEKYYPRKNHFGMHEIFHLFVMAGSFAHFWLMLRYVLVL